MKRAVIALLLSAFVLPGLGHLYSGQKTKGIVLLLLVNLLLLASLFFVVKLAAPLVGTHLAGSPVTGALIMEQLQPYRTWGNLLLAGFFGIWGFSLIDLITSLRRESGSPTN